MVMNQPLAICTKTLSSTLQFVSPILFRQTNNRSTKNSLSTFVSYSHTCNKSVHRRMKHHLTPAQLIQPPPESGKSEEQSGQVRVRQHVNPLARRWSQPTELPNDWYAIAFRDVSNPLVVDLGVAKGRFLLKLAQQNPSCNYLGLEIRQPLVHQANRVAAHAGLRNLFYVACNVNVSFASLFQNVPPAVLREIYIQFCDPWFKKRHAKRRMVNQSLVDDIHHVLQNAHQNDTQQLDRSVFVQTDVLEIAQQITSIFDPHPAFQRLGNLHGMQEDSNGWLVNNPIGVPTEREIAVINNHLPVYRALYRLIPKPNSP